MVAERKDLAGKEVEGPDVETLWQHVYRVSPALLKVYAMETRSLRAGKAGKEVDDPVVETLWLHVYKLFEFVLKVYAVCVRAGKAGKEVDDPVVETLWRHAHQHFVLNVYTMKTLCRQSRQRGRRPGG